MGQTTVSSGIMNDKGFSANCEKVCIFNALDTTKMTIQRSFSVRVK